MVGDVTFKDQSNNQHFKINAEVLRVTFQSEESGWTVLKAMDLDIDESFVCVGTFVDVQAGSRFLLFGEWVNHKQFGKQLKVDRYVETRPSTAADIKRYLSSGLYKGVGAKTAELIVNHFGVQTLTVLLDDVTKVTSVPKIGKKKAAVFIDSWKNKEDSSAIIMFLMTHGIGGALTRKIIEKYNRHYQTIVKVVSENPYQLINDINGIGFLLADRIALSVGIEPLSPLRIEAAVIYLLEQGADRGHCFLLKDQIKDQFESALNIKFKDDEKNLVDKAISKLVHNRRVICDAKPLLSKEEGAYYLSELYYAEQNVAHHLNRILNGTFSGLDPTSEESRFRMERWLERYSETAGLTLSSTQWQGVLQACQSKVFILTGGPGVGKTTTANAMIKLLNAMKRSISICAPTGRAAQRICELSSMPAKTIHRLLEWTPPPKGFVRTEDNPIDAQVVIADETSMIDIRLGHALFQAIPTTSQLILIGDFDQLPSVGPGNVLKDLIDSNKIPVLRLTEIFRQAQTSKIIQYAHMINKGTIPEFSDEPTDDCRFLEVPNEGILPLLHTLITEKLPQAGYDIISQVQILTPMNKGDYGSHNLNLFLQNLVNKEDPLYPGWTIGGTTFRPKDKVIQTSNNYDLNVFNGDIGFIVDVRKDEKKLLVRFQDRMISYEDDDILDLQLAYAITIHKSQGSEFPVVLIPMTTSHFVMLQRNLVYTALTRAKKLAVFLGQEKALNIAVRNAESARRQTKLGGLV